MTIWIFGKNAEVEIRTNNYLISTPGGSKNCPDTLYYRLILGWVLGYLCKKNKKKQLAYAPTNEIVVLNKILEVVYVA